MYAFHRRRRGRGDDRVVSPRGPDRLRRARVRRRSARPDRLPREARVLVPGEHGRVHPRSRRLGLPAPGPALADARPARDDAGDGQPVHCFRQPCYWLDIGRHDDYATANEIFEARRAQFLGEPSPGAARSSGSRPMTTFTLGSLAVAGGLPDRGDPVRLPASSAGHRRDRHPHGRLGQHRGDECRPGPGVPLLLPGLHARLLKGFAADLRLPATGRALDRARPSPRLPVLVALATILGHNFPIYLGFQGGKGVATSFGALLALDAIATLFAAHRLRGLPAGHAVCLDLVALAGWSSLPCISRTSRTRSVGRPALP